MQIRLAREIADMTQEELAEATDLTRATISSIERGVHSPVGDRLMMISDAVRVPLSHLVRET